MNVDELEYNKDDRNHKGDDLEDVEPIISIPNTKEGETVVDRTMSKVR